jgi:Cof subfamily protein (haloacid dehalogenase superfamily)
MTPVRLVATDLDHTLLRGDRTVSGRTATALDAVRAAGVRVVPVTARNIRGVAAVNGRAAFSDWAVCGNGACAVHLGTSEVLFSVEIGTDALSRVMATVRGCVPGVRFAVVRDLGARFLAEDGYADLAATADHSRDPATMERADAAALAAAPAGKLVFRHPTVPADQLFARITGKLGAAGVLGDVEVTLSGAPFVEVMAAGVDKATGLSRLCSHLGIDRSEVLALGDGLNDTGMLRWAGRGVAVANADPAVLAVADDITAAADDDGVASVLEQLNDSVTGPRRSS